MRTDNYVFLIGPARSGTKILRDVIATHPKIDRVPFDINFIWKFCNEAVPHDELKIENYNLRSEKFIKDYLNRFKVSDDHYLIEKTVSNSLRVPYILKNFPNARFIFLHRNGLDVIESVMRQWKAPNNKGYLLKKAKVIPLRILIKYGFEFVKRTMHRESSNYYWGVNTPNMVNTELDRSLESIVSQQWCYCIESMLNTKDLVPSQNLLIVRYEEMVENPKLVLSKALNFINREFNIEDVEYSRISHENIGKSLEKFSEEQLNKINSIIGSTVERINREM